MHQLALYETGTGVILKEQITGEKQNDLSIVSQFLTPTLVKGRILSADARPSQHLFSFTVTRWEGASVLIAKGNPATLRDDLQLFWSRAAPRLSHRPHGRLWPWPLGDPRTGRHHRTQGLSGQRVGASRASVSTDTYG